MLNSLYQNILSKLKEGFNEFGLTDTNFGFADPDKVYPFFSIEGQEFKLKTQQFKKAANKVKKHELTNELIVPSASARKKGPYVLESPPVEITSILVVKKPGASNESVTNLDADEYTIHDNELNLNKNYTGGTKVVVSYTSFGESYIDRFEQQFAIKIYEKDRAKLEKYSVLTLSAIWAGIQELTGSKYRFTTGNIQANFDLSELSFLGQSNQNSEISISTLNFMVSGTVVFVKTKTDGFHVIKEVLIGEKETAIVDEQGGVAVGLIKNSTE